MRLSAQLVHAARESGSELLNWHSFESFLSRDNAVEGGRVTDLRSGDVREIKARVVVNAAGAWGAQVLRKAGLDIAITFNRGAMLAFDGRMVSAVIQRLRWPSDFDAVLPRGRLSVAGTTGVSTEDPGDRRVEQWEKEKIRQQVSTFLPALSGARLVHAWAGVRPLYDPQASSAGRDSRSMSRRFDVIDHERRDGRTGLVSVVGGKLAIYRLMAERASDLVCRKLGVQAPCRTATIPLA